MYTLAQISMHRYVLTIGLLVCFDHWVTGLIHSHGWFSNHGKLIFMVQSVLFIHSMVLHHRLFST